MLIKAKSGAYFLLLGFYLLATLPSAQALPSFARREEVSCAVCHNSIPRLNRVGYEYRNAGYRMPENLGKEAPIKNFGDMNSARFQDTLVFAHNGASDGSSDNSININGSNMAVWLHPFSGSWGKYFASRGQLTYTEGSSVDIEHANVRMAYGDAESHFNARVGIIHPVEGYGAIDLNGIGLSSPLFLTTPANDITTGSTLFTLLGSNKAAVEVGYTQSGFDISIAMNNGNFVDANGDFKASVGGGNLKPTTDPNYKRKDFQVYANQFLGSGESAISVLYYHGNLTIPEAGGVPAANWTNVFDRASAYATVQPVKPVLIFAGFGLGWDHKLDANTGSESASKFRSTGWFIEPYYHFNEYVGTSLRFDYFDPSRTTDSDVKKAVTFAVNGTLLNGAQAIFEYQFLRTQTPLLTANDHTVQLALAYAF